MNLHTRIATEIGADIIKTEYTGDAESVAEVVRTCPTPILVLGGAKQETDGGWMSSAEPLGRARQAFASEEMSTRRQTWVNSCVRHGPF